MQVIQALHYILYNKNYIYILFTRIGSFLNSSMAMIVSWKNPMSNFLIDPKIANFPLSKVSIYENHFLIDQTSESLPVVSV